MSILQKSVIGSKITAMHRSSDFAAELFKPFPIIQKKSVVLLQVMALDSEWIVVEYVDAK